MGVLYLKTMLGRAGLLRGAARLVASCTKRCGRVRILPPLHATTTMSQWRHLTTSAPPPPPPATGEKAADESASTSLRKLDYDEQDDYEFEEPKTAGEKVRFYSKLFAQWMFLLSLAGLSGYMAYELIFSGVSPTKLYDDAFARLQHDEVVKSQITGEDMRCYGRGGSESRRNQVDSFAYVEENDKPSSRRTRIRFNIEGQRGKALVYAEVSDNLPDGEKFVYLICQDKRTGRVLTVVDNRDRIEEQSRLNASLPPSSLDQVKSWASSLWK